jgi:6-phosphogluconolactonase
MTISESTTFDLPFDTFDDPNRLPVNGAIITEKLNELWERSQSESQSEFQGNSHGESGAAESYSRVSLLDFVVFAGESTYSRAEQLIASFAQERPSRCILILVDSGDETIDALGGRTGPLAQNDQPANGLSAEIGIACGLSRDGKGTLCWERITIRAPRGKLAVTPNIVRSLTSGLNRLVVVDLLPAVIGEGITSELYELADYVFFDSRINRRKLIAKIEAQAGDYDRLFDIEYERDHPLREAIKQAFDYPEAIAHLPNLREIHFVSHSFTGSFNARAIYLCGWLSSKLGLVYHGAETRRKVVFESSSGAEISCVFTPRSASGSSMVTESGSPELALEFVFSGEKGEPDTTLSIEPAVCPDSPGSQETYSIKFDERELGVAKIRGSDETGYIIRRLSDTHRRGDYTASLRRALALFSTKQSLPEGSGHVSLSRFPNTEQLVQRGAELFASLMRRAVKERGRFNVALAGGSTPVELYRCLSGSVYASMSEWRDTQFFFGDERTVPPTHEESNYLMARENLFDRLQIGDNQIFRMKGEGDDLAEAAREYEQTIARRIRDRSLLGFPVFDLILLGMGSDGHTASVFPDYTVDDIAIDAAVAAVYVGSRETHRLTMTPPLINASRNCVFMISGASKAEALYGSLVEKNTPTSIIALSAGKLTFLVDEAATSSLNQDELNLYIDRW